MNEHAWDKKLNIDTMGRDASGADEHHHPYEPTPYGVLERLAESGYIRPENVVVDYGCGKGRVDIFLNGVLGCKTIGIEYDEKIYAQALQNKQNYAKTKGSNKQDIHKQSNIEFLCQKAENYEVDKADCFYFFNPFTTGILRAVLNRIVESYYENPRDMLLFFYYPDDAYISYLMSVSEITFLDEIDCMDLFEKKDDRERIMVFEIGGF